MTDIGSYDSGTTRQMCRNPMQSAGGAKSFQPVPECKAATSDGHMATLAYKGASEVIQVTISKHQAGEYLSRTSR